MTYDKRVHVPGVRNEGKNAAFVLHGAGEAGAQQALTRPSALSSTAPPRATRPLRSLPPPWWPHPCQGCRAGPGIW